MIHILSPSKSLDFKSKPSIDQYSIPAYLDQSEKLIHKLKTYSVPALGKLMGISSNLASLNVERYREWTAPEKLDATHKQAILTFTGDVYIGLQAKSFSKADLEYARGHLRILSGLYALLRPLDLIAAYRLEMGTDLKVGRKKNLYEFWGDSITNALNAELDKHEEKVLINLASNEYFKVINQKKLEAKLISPIFKDAKNEEYKIIPFFAKKARGAMSRYIIQNRISKPEDLKGFNGLNYTFNSRLSQGDELVFTREENQN